MGKVLDDKTLMRSVHSSTLQYTPVHFSILQYTPVHFSILQYTSVYFSTLQYTSVYFSTLQYTSVYFSILQYTPVYFSILQYTPVYCSSINEDGRHMATRLFSHILLMSSPFHSIFFYHLYGFSHILFMQIIQVYSRNGQYTHKTMRGGKVRTVTLVGCRVQLPYFPLDS